MLKTADHFYLNKQEPHKSCLLALQHTILQHSTHLTETVKYGMPCFCYRDKPLCYLWTDKETQEPYILMVDGGLLHHTLLQAGTRKRMKVLPIDPQADLPLATITQILDMAIQLRDK